MSAAHREAKTELYLSVAFKRKTGIAFPYTPMIVPRYIRLAELILLWAERLINETERLLPLRLIGLAVQTKKIAWRPTDSGMSSRNNKNERSHLDRRLGLLTRASATTGGNGGRNAVAVVCNMQLRASRTHDQRNSWHVHALQKQKARRGGSFSTAGIAANLIFDFGDSDTRKFSIKILCINERYAELHRDSIDLILFTIIDAWIWKRFPLFL